MNENKFGNNAFNDTSNIEIMNVEEGNAWSPLPLSIEGDCRLPPPHAAFHFFQSPSPRS
jgi:hypothetical protein